jgi:hypothetical protein
MKKIVKFSILVLSLSFPSCNLKEKNANIQLLQEEIKSLKIEVKNLKKETQNLKFKTPDLIVTDFGDLKLFNPNNLNICIYSKRPQKNGKTHLVVPAAFTKPNNKIDGLFIENGTLINSNVNEELNGICIISNNKLKIGRYNPLIINEVISKKQSLFQQVLLVFDSKIVECELFRSDLNLRRALVEINNQFFLIESKKRVSILDFQNLMISKHVKNAIYLDMGTYSEGWYKNENKTYAIGETMTQTYRQSNWLVFKSL